MPFFPISGKVFSFLFLPKPKRESEVCQMKLRGIDFGHVFCASGARNFDGNGYPFHGALKALGLLNFERSTLVTKTVTIDPRVGNMPLQEDGLTPYELKPKCIRVYPAKGMVLNSVGLSNAGVNFYLAQGIWQSLPNPFFISFGCVEKTAVGRLVELEGFVKLLGPELPTFKAPVGLQMNFSCPNTGVHWEDSTREIGTMLDIAEQLNIPLVIKLNALTPCELVFSFVDHPALDAISMSNTIPWGALHEQIHWKKLFGTDVSPLAHLGGGGLSGKPLLRIVSNWIRCILSHAYGRMKPIIGGGGILCKGDADQMLDAGAEAIEIGSCAILRPWRVAGIIRHVNHRMNGRGK
ncbi:hypothetical protein EXS71_00925 [Candidatus Uhrbacteria bacterium]|nr:hypothetical protein [Candidatus Uhrbacteria bacterium]